MPQKYKSNPTDDVILHDINAFLADRIQEWYETRAYLLDSQPLVVANRNSFQIIYQIGIHEGGQKRVFLKIRRQTHMKTLADAIHTYKQHVNTEKEYETLRELYLSMKGRVPQLEALRPLGYLEQWRALAMEEFPSTNLDRLAHREALRHRRAGKRFLNAANISGEWLAVYHARGDHIR